MRAACSARPGRSAMCRSSNRFPLPPISGYVITSGETKDTAAAGPASQANRNRPPRRRSHRGSWGAGEAPQATVHDAPPLPGSALNRANWASPTASKAGPTARTTTPARAGPGPRAAPARTRRPAPAAPPAAPGRPGAGGPCAGRRGSGCRGPWRASRRSAGPRRGPGRAGRSRRVGRVRLPRPCCRGTGGHAGAGERRPRHAPPPRPPAPHRDRGGGPPARAGSGALRAVRPGLRGGRANGAAAGAARVVRRGTRAGAGARLPGRVSKVACREGVKSVSGRSLVRFEARSAGDAVRQPAPPPT